MKLRTDNLNKQEMSILMTIAQAEARTPGQQLRRFVQEAGGLAQPRPTLPVHAVTQPRRKSNRDGRAVGYDS